ncbi:hypothetical protein [Paraburkholderia unamae]|uniref:hypothetical protein n=1 Tax=Paraburkholderia unamae TaxID=219649 RepID=UPI001402AB6C|nr:hypothetical protein [Paraburkholderia unamae]
MRGAQDVAAACAVGYRVEPAARENGREARIEHIISMQAGAGAPCGQLAVDGEQDVRFARIAIEYLIECACRDVVMADSGGERCGKQDGWRHGQDRCERKVAHQRVLRCEAAVHSQVSFFILVDQRCFPGIPDEKEKVLLQSTNIFPDWASNVQRGRMLTQ